MWGSANRFENGEAEVGGGVMKRVSEGDVDGDVAEEREEDGMAEAPETASGDKRDVMLMPA